MWATLFTRELSAPQASALTDQGQNSEQELQNLTDLLFKTFLSRAVFLLLLKYEENLIFIISQLCQQLVVGVRRCV